ncbi:MAG: hypothetical protein ABJP70_04705 [Erythrobacter sp.]
MKLISRIAMGVAAMGMAFAPIAAQANTRAGDSTATYAVGASQPGLGREASGDLLEGEGSIIILLFAAAAIAAGILILVDDDDQSPGAN